MKDKIGKHNVLVQIL